MGHVSGGACSNKHFIVDCHFRREGGNKLKLGMIELMVCYAPRWILPKGRS